MDCDASLDPRDLPARRRPRRGGRRRPRARRARDAEPRRLAAPRPPGQPRARRRAAPAHGPRADRPRPDARRPPRGAARASASSDRRFGWPLEMVLRAHRRRLAHHRGHRSLPPARGPLEGHRHRARGHRAHRPRHGRGAAREPARAVIAKAPVAGRVKTRLYAAVHARAGRGARRGRAARHARRACARRRPRGASSCSTASPGPWLGDGFEVIAQRGDGLDERLAAAFDDVGGPTFLIGMDTPQVTPALLLAGAARARRRAVRRSARRPTAATGASASPCPTPAHWWASR